MWVFLFLDVDHILTSGICYNTASVLCFGFSVKRHVGSECPDQGLNQEPLLWKVRCQLLDQGAPRSSGFAGGQKSREQQEVAVFGELGHRTVQGLFQ